MENPAVPPGLTHKLRPLCAYQHTLTFDNGEVRQYNAMPLLDEGTVFAPFREWKNFSRVYLDENHCVSWDIDPCVDSDRVWSNKVDLCPDSCYLDSIPSSV